MTALEEMFAELKNAPPEILPSKYWEELNKKNLSQLDETGFENFKQTLALNYFTFLIGDKDQQFQFLKKNLNFLHQIKAGLNFLFSIKNKHQFFSQKQSLKYNAFTFLLWEYVKKKDKQRYLQKLVESEIGNPPKIYSNGKLISQDLANSLLEFYSITEAIPRIDQIHWIMELGAGYGRTAFVFLHLLSNIKCFIVDIPPALFVSQEYLSRQFPLKKIFKFRPFNHFDEVKMEIEAADIIFLLPHQMQLLPKKSIDLFYNISSLHEMRKDQIQFYFSEIDRLTSQFFYFKQWKISKIPFDEITIKEDEYPIPESWHQIYHRDCGVQTYFFEAFYQLNNPRFKSR